MRRAALEDNRMPIDSRETDALRCVTEVTPRVRGRRLGLFGLKGGNRFEPCGARGWDCANK
jgi:hypothetical protein